MKPQYEHNNTINKHKILHISKNSKQSNHDRQFLLMHPETNNNY